jgi:hypothetical protein
VEVLQVEVLQVEVLLQVNVLGVMMYGPCGDMVSRIVV